MSSLHNSNGTESMERSSLTGTYGVNMFHCPHARCYADRCRTARSSARTHTQPSLASNSPQLWRSKTRPHQHHHARHTQMVSIFQRSCRTHCCPVTDMGGARKCLGYLSSFQSFAQASVFLRNWICHGFSAKMSRSS